MKAVAKKPSTRSRVTYHGLPRIARSQTYDSQHGTIGQILRNNIIQSNDKSEQEVDRVTDEVMRMPDLKVQRQVKEPGEATIGRTSKEEKRIGFIEQIIKEKWGDIIGSEKFKELLKDRILWYANRNDLAYKWAELQVAALSDEEKQKQVNAMRHHVWPEKPTFENTKQWIIISYKNVFIGKQNRGGKLVPAFYDPATRLIHTTSYDVDVIAHEALHFYASPEFEKVLGRDVYEGMTEYLKTEIHEAYADKMMAEKNIGDYPSFTISSEDYVEMEESIRTFLKSEKRRKNITKAYFTGDISVLKSFAKLIDKTKMEKH